VLTLDKGRAIPQSHPIHPIQLLSGRTLSNDLGALTFGVFVKLERSS